MRTLACLSLILLFGSARVQAGGWLTDFEEAKKEAAKRDLPILVSFSGSDWCHWCVKLEDEVLSKPEFKKYANDNFILFLADFPKNKKQDAKIKAQNRALAKKYKFGGFPTLMVLDKNGRQVDQKSGYMEGGLEAYLNWLKKVKAKIGG